MLGFVACLGFAACGPHNGPTVFRPFANTVDTQPLGEAVASHVGTPALGAMSVPHAYRWFPVDGRELWVWVACRGAGDSRACAVVVGKQDGQRLRLLAIEPSGWSAATLSDGADRAQLMAQGDDGRGLWRQIVAYDAEHDAVTFSRKQYSEGM